MKRKNVFNCGITSEAFHVHHIVPLAIGGTNRLTNLSLLCEACHGLVHDTNFLKLGYLKKRAKEYKDQFLQDNISMKQRILKARKQGYSDYQIELKIKDQFKNDPYTKGVAFHALKEVMEEERESIIALNL
ncbi:HNH endonuclease signature motif containing protein [Cytobacillus sp. OWB-43]|uniref:HNH endonuclease n=1 Tax=Cytobacillus sp. OWB-43 TaxID=3108468 RepID=UPI002B000342|nr:HNH endonuclease signature motif containing protein [Cytobacillus sp. OWB-43]MEA1853029.1 HNH endonuclease signature motif containing protein [Cytobacillus sp. OWB-43]